MAVITYLWCIVINDSIVQMTDFSHLSPINSIDNRFSWRLHSIANINRCWSSVERNQMIPVCWPSTQLWRRGFLVFFIRNILATIIFIDSCLFFACRLFFLFVFVFEMPPKSKTLKKTTPLSQEVSEAVSFSSPIFNDSNTLSYSSSKGEQYSSRYERCKWIDRFQMWIYDDDHPQVANATSAGANKGKRWVKKTILW